MSEPGPATRLAVGSVVEGELLRVAAPEGPLTVVTQEPVQFGLTDQQFAIDGRAEDGSCGTALYDTTGRVAGITDQRLGNSTLVLTAKALTAAAKLEAESLL